MVNNTSACVQYSVMPYHYDYTFNEHWTWLKKKPFGTCGLLYSAVSDPDGGGQCWQYLVSNC